MTLLTRGGNRWERIGDLKRVLRLVTPGRPLPTGSESRDDPVAGKSCRKAWYHPRVDRPLGDARRSRLTAGSDGNQPKPWLDPQGTRGWPGGARRWCAPSPSPLNDWKGVGRSPRTASRGPV